MRTRGENLAATGRGTRTAAVGTCAPIALFVYKRPVHTWRLLQSLTRNAPAGSSLLYVFCDGAKTSAEAQAVHAVRQIVHHAWAGQVIVQEMDSNLGLARSIISGINHILAEHEAVIVLEDDLDLAPGFLEFMNAALRRYHDEPRIMQISGYMFPAVVPSGPEMCFLPMISSWGWGTWRRAWQHFDPACSGWSELSTNPDLQRRFDLAGSYPYSFMLQETMAGRADSWAIPWYWSVFRRQGLTLFPAHSLVRNRGWDGSGTHCTSLSAFDTSLADGIPTTFPERLEVDDGVLAEVQKFFRRILPTTPHPAHPRKEGHRINILGRFYRKMKRSLGLTR